MGKLESKISDYGIGVIKCTCGHHHTAATHNYVLATKNCIIVFVCGHCREQTNIIKID